MPIYSRRLPSGLARNKHSLVLSEQRLSGRPLLDLTVSNPTQCFASYPNKSINAALSEISDYRYEPDPLGNRAARESICTYYQERGVPVEPEQLVLTASTSEAYGYLFKLLCDPDDEVLIPVPSYPLFTYLAALESANTVPYRLQYDGSWYVDFVSLRRALSPRTKAILIVNPNNPTGTLLSSSEREELLSLAAKHNLAIVSDEVFADYNLSAKEFTSTSLMNAQSSLNFVLNGLSKAAGMPQMKLGWIALNGPEAERRLALERLEVIADTYLSVGTPVTRALPQLLAVGSGIREQILKRVRRNLATLDQRIRDSASHRLHLDGGWSAIVQIPETQTEEDWVTGLIEKHGVITQPGYFFDMSGGAYLVLSLITPPETFDEGIELLSRYVVQHS